MSMYSMCGFTTTDQPAGDAWVLHVQQQDGGRTGVEGKRFQSWAQRRAVFLKIVESWQGECERVAARAEGCRKVSRKCRGSYKSRANHRKTSSTPKSRKQIIQTYQRGSSWKWYMKTWVVCHWRSLIIILDQSKAFFWATARSHLFRNLYPRAMRSEMQSRLDRPSFASHPRCFILLLLINLWCTIMIYHPWSLIILYHPSSMIAR